MNTDIIPQKFGDLAKEWLEEIARGGGPPISYADAMAKSESPLEERFWHLIINRTDIRKWESIEAQYVTHGRRLDSLFSATELRLNIELDGKAYHDRDRDIERDVALLRSGVVTEIIRIPFVPMMYYDDAVFAVLGEWHWRMQSSRNTFCLTAEEMQDEWAKLEQSEDSNITSDWIQATYSVFDIEEPEYLERYEIYQQEAFACAPRHRRKNRLTRRSTTTFSTEHRRAPSKPNAPSSPAAC